jgi:hypothetical protein
MDIQCVMLADRKQSEDSQAVRNRQSSLLLPQQLPWIAGRTPGRLDLLSFVCHHLLGIAFAGPFADI